MTVPLPVTQATLDAAVQAAAQAISRGQGYPLSTMYPGPKSAIQRDARNAVRAVWDHLATAHAAAIEQARADERERIAQAIEAEADLWGDGSSWDHGMTTAIEIARAGTSGGDRG